MSRYEDITITKLRLTTLILGGTEVTATAAELNILDGVTATAAELNKLDGVTRTAAEIQLLLQGESAGYKVAWGDVNLDATEFGIATGLTSIVAVLTSIKGTSAPANVIKVTWDATGGTLKLYGWKFTSASDNTLVAATSTASVKWVAIGAA